MFLLLISSEHGHDKNAICRSAKASAQHLIMSSKVCIGLMFIDFNAMYRSGAGFFCTCSR